MKVIIIDSSNNRKNITTDESTLISTLKDKIKSENRINGDIELVFNGVILEDNDDLFSLGIGEGATINYVGQFKAGLK